MKIKRIEEWVPIFRKMPKVGELLVQKKKITEDQLLTAIHIQNENRENPGLDPKKTLIGQILIERGDITENDLLTIFSEQLELPYVQNLSLRTLEEQGIETNLEACNKMYGLCPLEMLETQEFLPYKFDIAKDEENGNIAWNVFCFSADPWDYDKIIKLFQQLIMNANESLEVEIITETNNKSDFSLLNVTDLNVYISFARRNDILRTIEELKEFLYMGVKDVASENDYVTIRLFREILNFGIQTKSSDIHILPNNANGGLQVRLRKDGVLAEESRFTRGSEKFPIQSYDEFVNVILNEAKIRSHEKSVMALDGALQYSVDGVTYDMRIASVPVLMGQRLSVPKITIRILYKGNTRDVNRIGMLPNQIKIIKQLYSKSEGLTLLTGPTSSGKTTTIYSILNCMDLAHHACYTIENPVEYELPQAAQIQVEEKLGLTFANILRNMLRQDPDIVFVGEMRDHESAESVLHIANTGHTVLSTIHANSAYKVPQRLINMGISPHQIFSSLNLVISQRLVHKNCPECLKEYNPTGFERELLGLSSDVVYMHGTGVVNNETCGRCEGRGYIGRIGLFEILPTAMYPEWEYHADTPERLKNYFTSMENEDGEKLYPDLMEDAKIKMKKGWISPKSLASVFSRLEMKD
ncbi:type IV-A pilus assembly ATPase PilB [Synergistales bacterium]|nr:type IV-A pilus assembly ATPase PilB [Synergistales bacterium]